MSDWDDGYRQGWEDADGTRELLDEEAAKFAAHPGMQAAAQAARIRAIVLTLAGIDDDGARVEEARRLLAEKAGVRARIASITARDGRVVTIYGPK